MRYLRVAVGGIAIVALAVTAACSDNPTEQPGASEGAAITVSVSWVEGYGSLAEMEAAADLVVSVTIVDIDSVEVIDSDQADAKSEIPRTVFRARIDDPINSDVSAGSEIFISQTGGTHAGKSFTVGGNPMMQAGETAVLFLQEDPNEPGSFGVLGGPTGRLLIEDSSVRVLPEGLVTDAPQDASELIEQLRQLNA